MSSIDERIVAMSFENQVFEARVAQTMITLSKLDTAIKNIGSVNGLQNIEASANKITLQAPMSALDKLRARLGGAGQGAAEGFSSIESAASKVTLLEPMSALDRLRARLGTVGFGAQEGFSDVSKAAAQVDMRPLNSAIDSVESKFSELTIIATSALSTIVMDVTRKARSMASAFTLGPIQQGLEEYKTNLNSIQTILANTEGQQVSGLKAVNEHLDELNTYSDQTIYNFSEMAKNIGTFTAAGVDLDKSTQSIKGIANLAALSGSNSQQASTAMYQLSQAIAAGRVGLQDWNSVVNAGMGGAVFQKSLMRTAENMGALAKGAVNIDKATGKATVNGESFRNSIMAKPGEESWLTSDVLVETLKQFTGDMKEADLIAQGFSKSQAQMIMQQAKTAKAAATEVKTLSQVFDVAKETIGSGWSKTFQNIFGNFEESKKTFTEVSNAINGFINVSSDARNKVLGDWKELGGRTVLIEGIKDAFEALQAILRPIHEAFRDIFPAQTGKSLYDLTVGFRDLMEGLKIGPETADNLQRIFRGLFAVLHIGWTVVKEVSGAIFDLLGIVGKGSGGILNFAGSIGDFLTSLDKAISQGGLLKGVFAGIVSGLGGVIELFKAVGRAIGSIFTGANEATGLSTALHNLGTDAGPLANIADKLSGAWEKVASVFKRIKEILEPAFDALKAEVTRLGDALGEAFKSENFDKVLSVLQTGFLGGILLVLRRFRSSLDITLSGGFMEKINTTLGALTGNLKAMQQNLQAKTLFAIAASLGVLVAGIYVLSTIDPQKLSTAMTAMAVGMGQLVGALALLGKLMSGPGKAGILMMPFIAASMIGLAIAATILAAAVKIFSTMSWEELVKGLVGVGGALAGVGLAMKLMGPGTLVQGPALILIGIGLNILAAAVKQFGEIPWKQLVQGLLGMGFSLIALGAGITLLGPSLILVGPGLIAASIGMNMLAGAVAAFGSMNLEQLGKGILGVAGALVAIGLAISFIPPTVAIQGAGLVILAAGLSGLSAAIAILGSMKVGSLVKGIAAMGAALVVLGVGLSAMSGTLIGSAALLTAAAAFLILGPALAFIGSLKWSTIISGLGAIAVTLGVLAIAGTLVAGPITVLSFALGALGIALALVTSPIYVLAKALEILGASGTKGIAVMVTALTAFVALLPNIIINFLKGLVAIIKSIAELAPQVVSAVGVIIGQVLAVVIDAAPKLAIAAGALIMAFLKVITDNAPPIINAGIKLITDFLSGIAANIGQVASKAGEIITKFLETISGDAPNIAHGGVGVMLGLIGGIGSRVPQLVQAGVDLIVKFLGGITTQIPKVITAVVSMMLKFVGAITGKFSAIVAAGVNAIIKFVEGVAEAIPRAVRAAGDIAGNFIRAFGKALVRLTNVAFDAMIDFLNGFAEAIRENGPKLRAAGWNVADAIVDGIVQGFKDLAGKAVDAVSGLVKGLPGAAKKMLGIKSPSTVFAEIGRQTMAGMTAGLIDGGAETTSTVASVAQGVIRTAQDTLSKVPDLLDGMMDLDPVISPVLDLSAVEREAAKLSDLTNVTPITAAASYNQAAAASQEVSASQETQAAAAEAAPTFNFEQNNYSPEALSDVEIFRQTKNQLSQVKSVLGVPA